ncbi:MAG: preprotein translocase subunit YajC [Geminicoccaceae bacterium]|nr:preprotein translocase subunit YajC [Geminicoccaceae bacterium]MCB9943118.1 preprotein translocase subunit YajC [Geminicoccaceae bacterium]
MLISPAYAQAAAPAGGGDFFVSLLPLILIFVVFYFLLIRPQQKRAKDHRAMIDNLKRGDQIVTSGGIFGKITKVEDTFLMVEIAKDVQVKIAKGTVSELASKPQPAANANTQAQPASTSSTGGGFLGKLFKK